MNNERRKALRKLIKEIRAFDLEGIAKGLDTLKDEIEALQEDERDALDNLPEGTDRERDEMETAVAALEDALVVIENMVPELERVTDLIDALEEAAA